MGMAAVKTPALYPAFSFVLEKGSKSTGNLPHKTPTQHASLYRYTRKHSYLHSSILISLWTSSHKWLTFVFTTESGYTLDFQRKIAHIGLHAEARGFTFVQPGRVFDRSSSGRRTARGSGCTPMAFVRFLQRRGPLGRAVLLCICKTDKICCNRFCTMVWAQGGYIDSVGLFNNRHIAFLQNSSAIISTHLSIPSTPLSSVRW